MKKKTLFSIFRNGLANFEITTSVMRHLINLTLISLMEWHDMIKIASPIGWRMGFLTWTCITSYMQSHASMRCFLRSTTKALKTKRNFVGKGQWRGLFRCGNAIHKYLYRRCLTLQRPAFLFRQTIRYTHIL